MTPESIARLKRSLDEVCSQPRALAARFYEELFRTANRYRDLAVSADGLTLYLVTDSAGFGQALDPSGARVSTFANPGSILEFRYNASR